MHRSDNGARVQFKESNVVAQIMLLLFLLIGPSWTTLGAQTIKVKLVNGKSGHPMGNTYVNVWVGSEWKSAIPISTDKEGIAQFDLNDKGFMLINKDHPILKYADTIRIEAGYVLCQPHGSDYSWLAITKFPTKQVVEQGIVTENTCGKTTASPEPGDITIFVRPLSWWEKLRQ